MARRKQTSQGSTARRGVHAPAERSAAPSIDLQALTDQFGFAVRLTQIHVYDQFHRALWRRHHLHPGAFSVLVAIRNNPGVRPGTLADTLVVKRPNMTKLLDSLARRGWIERRQPKSDGRGVSLVLTMDGDKRIERIMREAVAMDEQLTEGLTKAERQTLLTLLNKLLVRFHDTRKHRLGGRDR